MDRPFFCGRKVGAKKVLESLEEYEKLGRRFGVFGEW